MKLLIGITILLLVSLACNLGQSASSPTAPPPPTIPVLPPAATDTTPPQPTVAPPSGPCTDEMTFVADVSVPDGEKHLPNEPFIKTWRIRNSGTCEWKGYKIVFAEGEPMGTMEQDIPITPAGEELDISVEMTAPGGNGTYVGRWSVQSDTGVDLGQLTCSIVVSSED